MKTIKEIIKVMEAFDEGKQLQCKNNDYYDDYEWHDISAPSWNWSDNDYRIKPEQTTRPMTLEEIIEWRKDSNGVVLWGDEITTVTDIYPKDKPDKICLSNCGWQSLDDFIKCARTPYGEKFEVEIEE